MLHSAYRLKKYRYALLHTEVIDFCILVASPPLLALSVAGKVLFIFIVPHRIVVEQFHSSPASTSALLLRFSARRRARSEEDDLSIALLCLGVGAERGHDRLEALAIGREEHLDGHATCGNRAGWVSVRPRARAGEARARDSQERAQEPVWGCTALCFLELQLAHAAMGRFQVG